MSIVALKRKTQVQYNNMSVGTNGFSLNGAFRGQGYIGQSTQSRTNVRSLAKGSVLKGHGGCCGKYPIHTLRSSELFCLDDPAHVRPSSLGTSGMLMTKYRWIRRPQPYATFKMNGADHMANSQTTYISNLVKKQLNELQTEACKPQYVCKAPCRPIGAGSFKSLVPVYKTVKEDSATGAISQSERMRAIDAACGLLDIEIKLVNNLKHTPFACQSVH